MSKGIVRKLDYEGRVVIPKELRDRFQLGPEDDIDIYCSATQIILEPVGASCVFCGEPSTKVFMTKGVCDKCQSQLYEQQY